MKSTHPLKLKQFLSLWHIQNSSFKCFISCCSFKIVVTYIVWFSRSLKYIKQVTAPKNQPLDNGMLKGKRNQLKGNFLLPKAWSDVLTQNYRCSLIYEVLI